MHVAIATGGANFFHKIYIGRHSITRTTDFSETQNLFADPIFCLTHHGHSLSHGNRTILDKQYYQQLQVIVFLEECF